MVHALELYSIRIHDSKLSGTFKERYSEMQNVRGHSLTSLIQKALSEYENSLQDYPELSKTNSKRVFKVQNLNESKNTLSGVISVGDYGTRNKVLNRISGEEIGQININDTVIRNHFFYLAIKAKQKKAILLIQSIRGLGVKSLFSLIIHDYVRDKTGGLSCQIRPLADQELVEKWLNDSTVCELRISKFNDHIALHDIAQKLGDTYTEVILKPRKKNARFGNIKQIQKLVDIDMPDNEIVKAVVEYEGKRRIFRLGRDEAPVSTIELNEEDSSMKFKGGNPVLYSLREFCGELSSKIWKQFN